MKDVIHHLFIQIQNTEQRPLGDFRFFPGVIRPQKTPPIILGAIILGQVKINRHGFPENKTIFFQCRNLTKGIAALCLGGGNAVAMAVERIAGAD